METSKVLAGLIGPTLVAAGASMLLNLGSLPALIGQASGDAALILTTGMFTFVAGLAIVRVHNRWSGGWPVIVTVSSVGCLSSAACCEYCSRPNSARPRPEWLRKRGSGLEKQ